MSVERRTEWRRFGSDILGTELTDVQKRKAMMPATNDANEGWLGVQARVALRRAPNARLEFIQVPKRKVEAEHDRQTVVEYREKKTKADLKKAAEIAEINKCDPVFDITQFTDPGMLKEILVPQLDLQLKWHRLRELKWTRRPKFRRYPRSRNNRRPGSLWPPYSEPVEED
ncbi:hypothetical protein B0H14DRAFT_2581448 [Mycena olivaceomarginata]|nr:hypothetical protein B0H14DRAFT_2581448 [Mycena olivaceomarginata]